MNHQPVAVVTGGGRGLGRAIAERLAHDGFAIALLDVDEQLLVTTVKEFTASGMRCVGL